MSGLGWAVLLFRCLVILAFMSLGWHAQAAPVMQQDAVHMEGLRPSYSTWSRSCTREADVGRKQICFTVETTRTFMGDLLASAMIVERQDTPRKTLRIVLPLGVQTARGTRIAIDGEKPIESPYLFCIRDGCVADYDATPELIETLRRGKSLVVRTTDQNGTPESVTLPLADLDPALDGKARDWSALEYRQRKSLVAMFRLKNEKSLAAAKPALRYPAPWTKFCLTGKGADARHACFTGRDGRQGAGLPEVAAVVIEPDGDPRKFLRLTLPLGMDIAAGTRLSIDGGPAREQPFTKCPKIGCMSDYELTPELLDRLRHGQSMTIQITQYTGRGAILTLPLGGFGNAYDGVPVDAKAFEAQQNRLQRRANAVRASRK